MDIKEIRKDLAQGDYASFQQLYEELKSPIQMYCQHKGIAPEESQEIFHDVMVVIYKNIVSSKLDILTSTMKTYAIGITKRLIYQLFKSKRKLEVLSVDESEFNSLVNQVDEQPENPVSEQIVNAIHTLGGSCKDLLIHFYFHRYPIKTIQNLMDYKNENTVKAHKSRCMKKLKELIHSNR